MVNSSIAPDLTELFAFDTLWPRTRLVSGFGLIGLEERLVCNSIVFEKNTSRGSISSFTERWHRFLKSSSAYSAVFVALLWAPFPFSTCEGKVLTPFKLNMGCVFSICDWQLSFANIYSINHLKTPYFCCLAFCIPDNAELFPGDIIKIVQVNDYLTGLKLAEFWLSFPKVCTSAPRASVIQKTPCFSFLFISLFLALLTIAFL